MEIVSNILPIFVMIAIGMICKKANLLSRNGTKEIKRLITTIVLPVAVFHAMATADYNAHTSVLVIGIFVVLLISFGIGFLLRPLLPGQYRRYLPFITAVYEGGMMAYPLYTNLFGADKLSNIAIFDIANMIFGFSVFMTMLQSTDSGKEIKPSLIVRDALKSPVFLAMALGIICGISGIIPFILRSDVGIVYTSLKDMITSMLNALILIIVGYDFEFDPKRVVISLRAILLRVLTQGLLFLPLIFLIRHLYPGNTLMMAALLIYMSAPPSFSTQSYIESEEPGKFIATTNSLYTVVSLAVYVVAAVMF